ncbi:MAG: hypothetical protein KAW84_06255 [Thermoplasmata archaeon]|nr:hypothetical protein [Thermoplasmata archaeon]
MSECIIEGGGRFQPFTYGKIPFPDYTLLVRYDGHGGQSSPHVESSGNQYILAVPSKT